MEEYREDLLAIIDDDVDTMWGNLYSYLEKKTNHKFSGDITPDQYLMLNELNEKMLDLFVMVAKENVIE